MPNSPFSFLASESSQNVEKPKLSPWKVLIVDDEPEIHNVTKMALSRFAYEDRELSFIHAYSKSEAIKYMLDEQDICVVLLDVIMETDNAGLECVHQIRQELKNHDVRIILRTGQPSTIPEHEVMLKYDINDYKNKVDLTKSKLYITMTSALRAYCDIKKQSKLASELKDLNDNLEAKVALRTAELTQLNQSLIAANEKILEQQNSLLQSEKMASVGYLASGMAHEINNPLGAMKCNFTVLKDYIKGLSHHISVLNNESLNGDLIDIFELLEDNEIDLNRIEQIVAALSVFNGVSDERAQLHNLTEIFTCFVSNLSTQIVFDHEPNSDITLLCCREQLLKVFDILHTNAIESGALPRDISVKVRLGRGNVSISFKDQGIGIEPTKLSHIFDPFYSSKPVGQNVGLGLTIALMLIKNHHGELIATSELGKGSCFEIRIPVKTS
ncbi:ATP-binding protein [Pseudoalteromonas obscura]|uniref:ATP-binding protein n=1 Tax=Pseudoalteromonas obscura TaxID=3048491 RepID=UPI0024DED3AB|nr:ATP-binding protein [Pseudoalteromonas sp. P94(2023)]